MKTEITVSLGGCAIGVSLLHEESKRFFSEFLTEAPAVETTEMTEEELREIALKYPDGTSDVYIECVELVKKFALVLLKRGSCMFHGAAFLWNGKAWIFAAPSGTGKTTQYLLWKKVYGDEVSILNGDKPVLSCEGGKIMVHPSPWCGKEYLYSMQSAPLGGIILLTQSKENRIGKLPASRAVMPVIRATYFDSEIEYAFDNACKIVDTILRTTDVWYLENRGDEASAILTHDTIEAYYKEDPI